MRDRKEELKSAMLEYIRNGGAWFVTRRDKYTKIGFSEIDNCYFARECFLNDGALEGGAYTFGTDWFDISFHGKYIDIYADPDTFREWPVTWSAEKGTRYKGADGCVGQAERLLEFCRQADTEVLESPPSAYQIDGTNFAHIISVKGDSTESSD